MKIRFVNIQKKAKLPFWYSIRPSFNRFWMGQIIDIGLNCYYIKFDFRGINSLQDWADSMKHPYTWKILKRISKAIKTK